MNDRRAASDRRFFHHGLSGLLLFLLLPPLASARLPQVEALASGDGGVRFTWRSPEAVSGRLGSDEGSPLTFGYDGQMTTGLQPGEPRVPIFTERLIVPDGYEWRLDFTVQGAHREEGVDFERVPEPVTGRSRPADGLWPESPVSATLETYRDRGLLILTIAPLQYEPATKEATLFDAIDIRVDFIPKGGAHRPTERGAVDRFGEVGEAGRWNSLVLNPEAALVPPRGAPVGGIPDIYFDDAPTWIKFDVKQNGLYRITPAFLSSVGIDPAGVDPAAFRLFSGPGTALRDSTDGADIPGWNEPGGFGEVSIIVEESPAPNGKFDNSDFVLFYGLGVDNFGNTFDPAGTTEWIENRDTDTNVYWLAPSGQFAGAPKRVPLEEAAPPGTAVSVVEDLDHVEVNDPSLYDPVPREVGYRWEKWFWQRIEDTGFGYFWDIALPDIDLTHPISARIRWFGSNTPSYSNAEPTQRHHLRVSVNDEPEVEAVWGGLYVDGLRHYDMQLPALPARTTNRVIANVTHFPDSPLRIDQILLCWMEWDYWKTLSLASHRLWFSGASAGTTPTTFDVAGGEAGVRALDVTDPRAVRLIPSTRVTGTATRTQFNVASPGGRRFALIDPSAILDPAAIRRDERPPLWLRDSSQGADYIVIAADPLIDAATELAAWRRTHLRGITSDVTGGGAPRNARVVTVRLSDIYDEFSGGVIDRTAIRNFLEYAFRQWTPGPGGAKLEYVCLLGDANRDTRDREGSGVKNLMPTWEEGYDTRSLGPGANPAYASDDFFARFDGPTDRITDLAIGRIPVSGADEALAVVRAKVIAVEQFPGLDAYRNRAILVADDVCQAGSSDALNVNHILHMESVDRSLPHMFDRRKVYLYDYGANDCTILGKPAAKRDLVAAMNEGGFIVNYAGHGGDQVLADEKVLETTDVPSLLNPQSLSLLIAASCSVGKFDRPGNEGLAEALLKWPSGGCLGTMAGTHLTYAGDNETLNQYIIADLFPGGSNRSITLGPALLQAKIQQTRIMTGCSSDIEMCDLQKKYLLFGDPAATLITANRAIRFTEAPDTLFRGSLVTIRGEVLGADSTLDAGFSGSVDLYVQDQPETQPVFTYNAPSPSASYQRPGATIFSGKASVSNGRFEASFVVPVSLRGGPAGRLRALAASSDHDAVGAVDPLPIGGLASDAPTDTLPPSIVIDVPGGTLRPGEELAIAIADPSGINLTGLFEFRSIQVAYLDQEELERFRANVTGDFSYDEGSHQQGHVMTRVPDLPGGDYVLRLTATDNFNNRGVSTIPVRLSNSASEGALSSLYAIPNPFAESTEIAFELSHEAPTIRVLIFSVSGRKVREWSIAGVAGENRLSWDGTDGRGDPVANGVYLVKVAARPAENESEVDLIEPIVRLR